MKRYRFELIFGVIVVAVFFAASAFQTTNTLTRAEVDRYIATLEKNLPADWEGRGEFIARLRAWGESDDDRCTC